MKRKILFVFALFFMLTGFNGGDRIVEQNGVSLQGNFSIDDEAPQILEKPKFRLTDNGNIIIEVRFEGTPMPQVTWYHNLKVIGNGSDDKYVIRVFMDSFGTKTTTLEIKDPVLDDDGFYKVTIKNALGEVSATVRVAFGGEA